MGLEPTAPALQTRPTRTPANSDERLRLVSDTFPTSAHGYERLRVLAICRHETDLGCIGSMCLESSPVTTLGWMAVQQGSRR
jgi:hypothetical protein